MKRTLAIALFALLVPAALSHAQTAQRIGVVDAVKVLNDMQEMKDLQQKRESEGQALETELQKKNQHLTDLRSQRNMLRPDHPQYAEKNNELVKAEMETKVWSEVMRSEFQRKQKLTYISMFGKIQDAIKEVATTKGLDLVLASQSEELPPNLDQASIDVVRSFIYQRSVLYSNDQINITNEVLAVLDAKYKAAPAGAASGNTGAAPAAQ